ncbi:MAG TPA: hypothetical protein VMV14_04435 [Acidimicrobiales bacterium]|nr:hypothetical protein [Acidimicrobiales bacterium]
MNNDATEDRLRRTLRAIADQPVPAGPPTFEPRHARAPRVSPLRVAVVVAVATAVVALALAYGPHGAPGSPSGRRVVPVTSPQPATVPGAVAVPATSATAISGFLAQSVSFVSDSAGFVLGLAPCPAGTCVALRRTTDRGATWSIVPPPPTTLGTTDSTTSPAAVSQVRFADEADGWAYGPGLWATHDGGTRWSSVDLGGPVVSMASSAGQAYALVQCLSYPTCTSPGHLYRSPVHGGSWTQVAGVSGAYGQGSATVVAVGPAVFVADGRQPQPTLIASADGVHFSSLTSPCGGSSSAGPSFLVGVAASSPTEVAVACTGSSGAGSSAKSVYLSHDGGRSFDATAPAPLGGDESGLSMPSATTVLLGANSGATWIYRIASPDTAWTTPLTFTDGGIRDSDMAFVDADYGAMVHGAASLVLSIIEAGNTMAGFGQLFLTADGGLHWQPCPIRS